MNSVGALLYTPFARKAFAGELKIKALGQPVPDHNFTMSYKNKQGEYKQYFNKKIYDETLWICGVSGKKCRDLVEYLRKVLKT
ncbi:hypothetical protein PR048_009855 [Dryococelus australis]|uniref:Uncharacterized protein n=1 Tax=Dryococelus australis TaxID=614101 RepID=A0ABQ9I1I3_9NEOP|nr:hypothetical protein PR048_009855 [Dryococelus australis]